MLQWLLAGFSQALAGRFGPRPAILPGVLQSAPDSRREVLGWGPAVGLCSKEEAAYHSALSQYAMVETDFDAASEAQQTHNRLVDLALTIIVRARQRPQAPPSQSARPIPPVERGHLKSRNVPTSKARRMRRTSPSCRSCCVAERSSWPISEA